MKSVKENNIKQLQAISIETFSDTFSDDNSSKDLKEYLEDAYSVNKLTNEMMNPGTNFQFIIANNQIAGYLKLNVDNAQSEEEGPDALKVERIYIKKEFKRQGLGKTLMNYSIQRAKASNKSFVWLGVWEYNQAAINFYDKMGFNEFSDHVFQLGDSSQRDILMKKDLR